MGRGDGIVEYPFVKSIVIPGNVLEGNKSDGRNRESRSSERGTCVQVIEEP